MKNTHCNHIPMSHFMILSFLLSFAAVATAADDPNRISINCGGAASAALTGRYWWRDAAPLGSSTTATVKGKLITTVDPVPYKTARISRSKFSYTFPMSPGQKFIRLHFNPASYHGFQSFSDLFTVEAGPFLLLANFSASITGRALSVNTIVKEFCITLQENQPLNIVFSPETNSNTKENYAFINGIEIISVPSTIPYCRGGDTGVHVLSQPGMTFILDNTTALERVHRQHIKLGSSSTRVGIWYSNLEENAEEETNGMIWRVSVDVGFRYLIRLHFCEVELQMDFRILIDDMVAFTSADMLHERGTQSFLWHETYMVMVEGRKQEDKRSISVSINSQHEYMDRHGPLEGFEVFKLSNHDHSLASPNPNPLPPRSDSPSQTIRALLGHENAIATLVFTVLCLVNTIVWGANFFKEKNKPYVWSEPPCRCFSLAEILSATDNFQDAFVLGEGGFGNLYKGFIDNGREIVAIKRLKQDLKPEEHQFATEVETLAKLRHNNLVSLIGYCREKQERMLVYEYMASGTLADRLHKQASKGIDFLPLSWKQRLKICIGVGRALDYLHTGHRIHGIIHGDLKPINILLDENLVAKISDFGLAKLVNYSECQSQDRTTIGGALGYMDLSYFQTSKATRECDIYSFGVVLLEVLCGRAAVGPWYEEGKCSLSMWAMEHINKGQVDHILDQSLRGEISPNSLNTFVKIAERCLHDEQEKRPAALYVVTKLELALQQQEKVESLVLKEDTNSEVFSSTDQADSLSIEENLSIMDNFCEGAVFSEETLSLTDNHISPMEGIPNTNFPPGLRFHPSDEELILSYLEGKVKSLPFPADLIDANLWDLPSSEDVYSSTDKADSLSIEENMSIVDNLCGGELFSEEDLSHTHNHISPMEDPNTNFSTGIRFHPSDQELISYYLQRKVKSRPLTAGLMANIDLYSYDFWDLPRKTLFGEEEWYFHPRKDRKYLNRGRPNRTDPNGLRMDWIMKECSLPDTYRPSKFTEYMRLDNWVLSSNSLNTFVKTEERCLRDETEKWLLNKTGLVIISASAPISRRISITPLRGNTVSDERIEKLSLDPTLRFFSLDEIKAATKNFSSDTIIGEGGFGKIYKGWIHENPNEKKGSGSIVAVKKLNHESMQGFKEWQSEVKFLGKLSHPNLVKLLGYGWDDKVLFLVYEFMQKGSLENHLSRSGWPPLQPMQWHVRLRIAIEAARGLAFLHTSDTKVIYRDFKFSNILLDKSYNAKISIFGLTRAVPEADATHVSIWDMGTHGYAAPEYIATGHLTTKSDVYSFGVVLLELLTGLVAIDSRRPAEQQNLVDWMKPHLSDMRKLNSMIDPCCSESAPQIAQLALNCLQMIPKCRQTMQQVVETLESLNTAAQKP